MSGFFSPSLGLYYILELWVGGQEPPHKLVRKGACLDLVHLFVSMLWVVAEVRFPVGDSSDVSVAWHHLVLALVL